jgi:hypothetical protein
MSNAGFSNLDTLKKHLLAGTLQNDKRFDAAIAAIGLGAAGAIARHCQREFARVENATEIKGADHVEFLLSRYPLESVSQIELKRTEALGWVGLVINDVVTTIDLADGIIHFAGRRDVGPPDAQLRFTFTGGYWWDTAEPDAENYPTPTPAGAAALPDDLRLAWLLQCEAVWMARDKVGKNVLASGTSNQFVTGTLPALEIIPLVKQMLADHVRYNLV